KRLRWEPLPEAVGIAERRDAALGRDARAGENHDAPRLAQREHSRNPLIDVHWRMVGGGWRMAYRQGDRALWIDPQFGPDAAQVHFELDVFDRRPAVAPGDSIKAW